MSIADVLQIKNQMLGDYTVQAVSGRALHGALGLVKAYTTWIASRIKALHLQVGVHYTLDAISLEGSGERSPRFAVDHILPLDVAKSIAMMTGTDIGDQVREYFLACEKTAQARTQELQMYSPVVSQFIKDIKYAKEFAELLSLEPGKVQKYAIEEGTRIEQQTGVKVLVPQLLQDAGLQIDYNSPDGTLAHAALAAIGSNFTNVTQWRKMYTHVSATDINNTLIAQGYANRLNKSQVTPTTKGRPFCSTSTAATGYNRGKELVKGWNLSDKRLTDVIFPILIELDDYLHQQWIIRRDRKGLDNHSR